MTISRLATLRKMLRRRKLDAILVTQPDNRFFLSGYTAPDHGIGESSGVLLIPRQGEPFLLTDSRFTLQAQQEACDFQVELYNRGLISLLNKLLPQLAIKRLAFESTYFLHSSFNKLEKCTQKLAIEIVPSTDLIEKSREIKSEEEIAALHLSTQLNEKVFQTIYSQIEPGISELELSLEIETTMRKLGAQRPSFDTIVAFGDNSAKPHAMPTERRLQDGEIVLIDMGLIKDGYCSDMTRTFFMGQPDELYLQRHRVVRKAQLAGIATIRAGAVCRDVDTAARKVIAEAGYKEAFAHSLGHGVGLAVHEEPRLSNRSRKKLRSGMVVTVEPGVYFQGWGGIRLENMVIVRDDGCELVNTDTTHLDL
ncbi:MAG: aminopeptidase P family protein [Desulfobulbaceae bacterium]|nr:aminopeptidase P family protein [Desulfobulbaceae bacterium]